MVFGVSPTKDREGETVVATALPAALARRFQRLGSSRIVVWLVAVLVAPAAVWAADLALLQSYELVTDAQGWQLRLNFDSAPTQVLLGEPTADGVRLELEGCRAAAEVGDRGYEDGPLAAVQLEHRQRGLAFDLRARQPMEYTVSTGSDNVTVGLRLPVGQEERGELGRSSALAGRDELAGRPSAQLDSVSVSPPAARVEVSEPLATVDTSAYAVEKVAVTAPLARDQPDESATQLEDRLQAWAAAWREQKVDLYLDHYSPAFRPADGGERAAWAALRRQRLGRPLFIDVQLEEIDIRLLGEDRATVSFWQIYRSDTFSDRVRKTMTWVEENGIWKIVGERVDS